MKGFTLIELLIVVAILAIFAVVIYRACNVCNGRPVAERCLHGQIYLYDKWDRRYIGPKLSSEGKPIICAEKATSSKR